jgi:hypothetical protein
MIFLDTCRECVCDVSLPAAQICLASIAVFERRFDGVPLVLPDSVDKK